jgi:two-component system chemotaxis response regulator CheB
VAERKKNKSELCWPETEDFYPYTTCPECCGPTTVFYEKKLPRFRCQIGHLFSPETMLKGKCDQLEHNLIVALTRAEELALLAHHLLHNVKKQNPSLGSQLKDISLKAKKQAEAIREWLRNGLE